MTRHDRPLGDVAVPSTGMRDFDGGWPDVTVTPTLDGQDFHGDTSLPGKPDS